MHWSRSSHTCQWRDENKEQGDLCRQCLSLFSSLKSLNSLVGEGLPISVKRFFVNSPPACPLCLRIWEIRRGRGFTGSHFRGALFTHGFDKSPDFRLVAEYELDLGRSRSGYSRRMLSVTYLSLIHTLVDINDLGYDPHLLTIYKSLGMGILTLFRLLSDAFEN